VKKYEEIIPIVSFKPGDKDVDVYSATECVICMDPFKKGDLLRKLPTCSHLFHPDCIIKWLKSSTQVEAQKCPQCNCVISPDAIDQANNKI
jgi:E3 ubiquitin-protein ligase ATL6/9/15/31/42/55